MSMAYLSQILKSTSLYSGITTSHYYFSYTNELVLYASLFVCETISIPYPLFALEV